MKDKMQSKLDKHFPVYMNGHKCKILKYTVKDNRLKGIKYHYIVIWNLDKYLSETQSSASNPAGTPGSYLVKGAITPAVNIRLQLILRWHTGKIMILPYAAGGESEIV